MSTFVEVHSNEKNCPVIINLEHVVEIAPLVQRWLRYCYDSRGCRCQ